MTRKIFSLTLFALLATTAYSQTEVEGDQSGTWVAAASPFLVAGDINVPEGATLHIEAGVEVIFQGHYKFIVNGAVTASGTETDSIVFTAGNSQTGWHGMRLTESQSGSSFSYCHFAYGKTSGSNFPDQHGGALMMNNSNAVISHCLFTHNEAVAEENGMGGALYGINTNSETQIVNCTFSNNNAYGEGGAIKLTGDNGANIENCVFRNNSVLYGGGAICLYGCYDTQIFRSLFTGNVTTYASGGAISILGYCARVRLVSCTIYDNHASHGDGGGVDIVFSDASFTNSIIYNNPGAYSDNIYLDFGYAEVNYCNTPFPDGAEGSHNINTDARFVAAGDGNFHLLPDSPCIDTGIDSLTITDAYGDTFTVIDMDESEYYNTAPDMGCYEYDPETGIHSGKTENISIYPNPTDGLIHFELRDKQISHISVTDFSGKNSTTIKAISGTAIDLSELNRGVYIINIHTTEGRFIGKVIKR